ncbi:hypothetical protein E2C01_068269 [Portunus trituberculatus]|uniref:Uncharacterized protein n=1 Tax=Portunus trituberculatus TaxID=210409 RepID=A0A5B7HW22_PORTR|nr:hypothetical protein [Portunus trituberculatus]
MTCHTPRPSHCHEVSPLTPKGPPLVLPVSGAWCTACHTPRPSHCHEVSPLTPKGPPSYCQCLVHGTQRALIHGELFSLVPSQARDPYTPSTRLYGRSSYHPFRSSRLPPLCRQHLLSALGPRPNPTTTFSPSTAPKAVTALNKF